MLPLAETPAFSGKQTISPKDMERPPGRTWSVLRLRSSRFAPANHSAHCFGSSAHPPFLERADGTASGLATTAMAFGQAVSLRTRANRLRFVTRFAEAYRRNFALERVARDATTRSITVAPATVWLFGRKT